MRVRRRTRKPLENVQRPLELSAGGSGHLIERLLANPLVRARQLPHDVREALSMRARTAARQDFHRVVLDMAIVRGKQRNHILEQRLRSRSELCSDEARRAQAPQVLATQERSQRLGREPLEVRLQELVGSAAFVEQPRFRKKLVYERMR